MKRRNKLVVASIFALLGCNSVFASDSFSLKDPQDCSGCKHIQKLFGTGHRCNQIGDFVQGQSGLSSEHTSVLPSTWSWDIDGTHKGGFRGGNGVNWAPNQYIDGTTNQHLESDPEKIDTTEDDWDYLRGSKQESDEVVFGSVRIILTPPHTHKKTDQARVRLRQSGFGGLAPLKLKENDCHDSPTVQYKYKEGYFETEPGFWDYEDKPSKIIGDEGEVGPPPYFGFGIQHRIEPGITNRGLSTGHESLMPSAWGWDGDAGKDDGQKPIDKKIEDIMKNPDDPIGETK